MMKTIYFPLGMAVLTALSACTGEKEAPPVAPVPAVPAPVKIPAAPEKATPRQVPAAESIRRPAKKKAPTEETIRKPEEIIRTQTIVS